MKESLQAFLTFLEKLQKFLRIFTIELEEKSFFNDVNFYKLSEPITDSKYAKM